MCHDYVTKSPVSGVYVHCEVLMFNITLYLTKYTLNVHQTNENSLILITISR